MKSLPTKSQIKIVKHLFAISDAAILQHDHQTLYHLSKITTELNQYNPNAPISFFDLGEYFYDTSTNIETNRKQSQDDWTNELGAELRKKLRENLQYL